MSDDQRRLKRRKSDSGIAVLDLMTQTVLGTISDLSETGMMLSTALPIYPDGLYQCEIRFPTSSGTIGTVLVGAQELWTRPDNATGKFSVGFRFIDIGKDERRRIHAWVNEPGSTYA
jgi:hypothetical protein